MVFFEYLVHVHPKLKRTGIVAFLLFVVLNSFGAGKTVPVQQLSDGYYVVVGVFKFVNNAVGYTKFINELDLGIQAKHGLLPSNEMHYVYAGQFKNIDEARQLRTTLRQQDTFADAWVLQVAIEAQKEVITEAEAPLVADLKMNFVTETTSELVVKEIESEVSIPVELEEKKEVSAPEKKVVLPPLPEGMYRLYVNTINVDTKQEIVGPMEVVDSKRAKVMAVFDSHLLTVVSDPKNGSSEIMISSKIFGYRREHHVISLENPLDDETKGFTAVHGDTIVVNYELQRYQKGDVFTLFNVIFFKDAAIMRPESKYEMNNLLAMLQENSKYQLRIHGHTNTNSPGQLISMAEGANNYFSLSPDDETNTASAKKLSFNRAFTIQHYLMANGIGEDRMEVKGWGGKKMIYDKHDAKAKNNVRVEIEILEN